MNPLTKIKQALGFVKDKAVRKRTKVVSLGSSLFFDDDKPVCATDIISTCDHRIASAFAKAIFKSVKEDGQTGRKKLQQDSINALFSGRVNQLATFYDFKYKACRLLLQNDDVFIYPAFKERRLPNGKIVRDYMSLYLIDCANVTIYPSDDEMRIEFKTSEGETFDLPYSDVIHWRYKFSSNRHFGGDGSGNDIRDNLKTMRVIIESIPKTIEAGLKINGILTMKGVADADAKELTREEFEQHLVNSPYGIVATDYESDFTPININPKDIPSNIMEFIRKEILAWRGVSEPIYTGSYNDAEYLAFYDTSIEGLCQSFKEAMDVVLFTNKARKMGYQIKVYDRRLQSLSLTTRISILKEVMPSALLHRDEQRELLGYEPDEEPDRVSLNWIETSVATQYQLSTMQGGDDNASKHNTNGQYDNQKTE